MAHLTGRTPPRRVRLDFRDLSGIDALGPSALLMIRRHTSAAGATLRLDDRPEVLERLLRQTGVLGRLTATVAAGTGGNGVTGAPTI